MTISGWVGWAPLGLLCAFTTLHGCGNGKTQLCQGFDRCACYANMTCNAGLTCQADGICVNPNGQGGSSAGGTGGTPNSGGTPNDGGTPNSGGTPNDGGTPNNGGTPNSGGTPNDGGTNSGGSAGGSNGVNLIQNGDFSAGSEYWELTWQAGQVATESSSGGEYCITNASGSYYLSFSLGFPPTPSDAFALEAGASYTLSYRASGYGVITAKIGQAVEPYAEVDSFVDVASGLDTTFTHVVTSAAGEAQAGLVFNGELDYLAEVCFDDVVFMKN